MAKNRITWLAVLFLGLLLSSCVTLKDPEASLEYTADVVSTLQAEQSIGQTLISHRPGFNGIQLWLRQVTPPSSPEDTLTFKLYHSPQDENPLVTIPVSLSQITHSFPVTISFSPQDDPPEQDYYVELEIPSGSVQVFGRAEDAYSKGSLVVNNSPQDMDAAFRLSYDYGLASMLDDIRKLLRQFWLILPMLIVLWLPGNLVVAKIEKLLTIYGHSLDWGQRTALSVGLSVSLIPLVMLWTTTIGLKWSKVSVIAGAIIMTGFYIWRVVRNNRHSEKPALKIDKIGILLFMVFLFSLAIRLVMTRDLAAPAWVDPVHHSTITRLIVEQGGFPENYAPYVEANTAGYHPGFYSVIASFHWLSNMEIDTAMLLVGQVLNALAVLAAYLFTVTFTGDRQAGLVAALVTGVFSPMPAYYASWGRYTQLTGLLILPVCFFLLVFLLKQVKGHRNPPEEMASTNMKLSSNKKEKAGFFSTIILVACLACGGLAITHYRVVIFLATLLIAYLIAQTIRSLDKEALWVSLPSTLALIGLVVFGSVLITLPWWPTFYLTAIAPKFGFDQPASQPLKIDWGYLTPVFGKQVLILATLGLIWSIIRARWFGLTLALWIGFLFMTANQGIIRFPGAGFVNKTSVEIMLFLPLSVLAGYLVSQLIQIGRKVFPNQLHTLYNLTLFILIGISTFAGAQKLMPILNPITFFIREADKQAIDWVEANIPPNETVLINPFLWNKNAYAGQDGGYWITPNAGVNTLPPPVLYTLGDPEQIYRINQLCQQIIDNGKNPEELNALLKSHNIKYVYIGVRGGVLSPKSIKESALFQSIYEEEGVWIFKTID